MRIRIISQNSKKEILSQKKSNLKENSFTIFSCNILYFFQSYNSDFQSEKTSKQKDIGR